MRLEEPLREPSSSSAASSSSASASECTAATVGSAAAAATPPLPPPRHTTVNPRSDYTPPKYITLLFTDIGVFTPSAVSDELIKLYH